MMMLVLLWMELIAKDSMMMSLLAWMALVEWVSMMMMVMTLVLAWCEMLNREPGTCGCARSVWRLPWCPWTMPSGRQSLAGEHGMASSRVV